MESIVPKRVQRSRQSKPGIPEGAVNCTRPTQWGNPAKIGEWYKLPRKSQLLGEGSIFIKDNRTAVAAFYEYCTEFAERDPYGFAAWLRPLYGRDLCCWCNSEQICHTDILLYFANTVFFRPVEQEKAVFKEGFIIPNPWPTFAEIVGWKAAV